MHEKEADGLVFGCEEFTDLLSFPLVVDIHMFLVSLSSVNSHFPVLSPGCWGHLPAERFKMDNFFGYVWWLKLTSVCLAVSPVKLLADFAAC